MEMCLLACNLITLSSLLYGRFRGDLPLKVYMMKSNQSNWKHTLIDRYYSNASTFYCTSMMMWGRGRLGGLSLKRVTSLVDLSTCPVASWHRLPEPLPEINGYVCQLTAFGLPQICLLTRMYNSSFVKLPPTFEKFSIVLKLCFRRSQETAVYEYFPL